MTDFFDEISALSPKRLALLAVQLKESLEQAQGAAREPIAVIGIGCRFPGADGPDAFWALLREGREAIQDVPADRWAIDAYFDPDPDAPGKMSTRCGGFLDQIDRFDPQFFGITPREANLMDPQQRLLLEVSWEALEHAGLAPARLAGSRTGVFVGICNTDYHQLLLARDAKAIDAYLASGNAHSVASGRISYVFGFQGPSLAIDTSCSASLVAIHTACQSLRSGESTLALAGGVNIICAPETSIALSKGHMLAPDGRCKTFDSAADGFARAEGCGIVVLKRFSDAQRDGDRILALVCGGAINQDGRSSGLTVPNGPAQEAVIRDALAAAGLNAADIGYVEAHGTGTALGDPIEVRALGCVLGEGRAAADPLMIGSVKTNFGHLESAAGVAGFIKVVLALHNEEIPSHLHFKTPSPHIEWASLPVAVAAERRAWPRGTRPRRAGVSSFGFSGTNAHVVIEEGRLPDESVRAELRSFHCLPLSARSNASLREIAARYAQAISAKSELTLADIAHTAGAGRSHFSHRLAVVADTTETAADALRAFISGRPHPALHSAPVVPGQACEVVFLFAGQGSQHPGMGRQIYNASDVYRDAIDQCDRLLGADACGRTLKSVLWSSDGDGAPLDDPAWGAPALFSAQYAATRLWTSFGVAPAAVVGYADGEYAAACAAGVFSLEDGLLLIAEQGRRMQSGDRAADAVETCASRVRMSAPQIPIAWTAGSHAFGFGDAPDAEYWRHHLRQPVRFEDGVTRLHQAGNSVFLEVSPDPMLISRAKRCLPDEGSLFLTSLRRGADDWSEIASSLAGLYVHGAAIDWAGVSKGARRVALPTYPFERRSYWYTPAQAQGRVDAAALRGSAPPPDAPLDVEKSNPDVMPSLKRRAFSSREGAADSANEPAAEDLFYQVLWESAPLSIRAASSLNSPDQFASSLRERFATLARHHGLSVYDRLLPELDRLAAEYLADALRQLGFDEAMGRLFVGEEEADRLGVAPRHRRLFGRLLKGLADDGVLRPRGAAWEIVGSLPVDDPEQHCRAALAMFPDVDAELRVLQRCGHELARALTGAQDPLELVFPGGSFNEARKLYIESPPAKTYNDALGEALIRAIETLPPGASLRVLEIGAGTGGTTSYVLPLLPPDKVEYVFTDVSPLFLERAVEQFGAYCFLRTALLDIEKEPFDQGFQPGQFDVVIAANALHATRDLTETAQRVRRLLAPGGLLFLLEGVESQRWTNISFALIEGWWRFADPALRPDYPLIDSDTWRGLLEGLGFTGFAAIPSDASGPISERQQALILARAPAAAQRWVVVGDCEALGAVLADQLRARGDLVTLLEADAPDSAVLDGDRLVYLGALELASLRSDDVTAAPLCGDLACELPIRWLARFAQATGAGRSWLVTRGAQPAQGQLLLGARWQAPLWGLGRAFSLEQPDHWGGLVDLPPDGSLDTLAKTLVAAIEAGDGEDQSAFRDGRRYVPRLKAASAPDAAPAQFRSDASYLIVGGFGGIGLLVARWMAERGARHIALLGRRPDPTSDAIRAIEALGARVICLAGDVADEAGMRTAFNRLAAEAPPLRGVVHAATDANATLIDQLTTAQIHRMLRPKIAGTVVLERMTRNMELDFVVLFSSTAALLGYSALGHYAAANMFLDATAHAANRPGRRVLAVNWGAWEEIRMASNDAMRSFREAGLLPLSKDAALDALGRLLGGSAPQGIVARIDWALYKPLLEVRRRRPFLSCLGVAAPPAAATKPQATPPRAACGLPGGFAQTSAAERQKLMQDFIGAAVAAVLGLPNNEIPPDLNLFEMGIDSLMSLELKRRLEAGIAQSLPSNLIFNHPTAGALANFVASALETAVPSSNETVQTQSAPWTGEAPSALSRTQSETSDPEPFRDLSYSQKALWFLHQQDPQSTAYHVSLSVRVLSTLDTTALRSALQAVIDRHAILRTTYAFIEGAPRQRVSRRQEAALDVRVIGDRPDDDLRELLEADARRPFDLEHGPVIRASVYHRGPENHALLLSVHHIAVDGWSILTLIEELLKLYGETAGGPAIALPTPALEYCDYARWQEQMLAGREGDRLWAYWRKKLAPPRKQLELPTDYPKPTFQTFEGASLPLQLGAGAAEKLMNLARQERTTPFVVTLAAFQVFLSRLAGADDVIVGTSTFARSKPEFMQVVGDFVNSVPIRGRLSAELTFADFVAQIAATVAEAIEAQEFPLPLLVQRLQPERSAGGSPLFDTFFSFLRFQQFKEFALLYGDHFDAPVEIGGLCLAAFPIEQGAGQFALSLQMVEIAGSIRGAFKYRADLFEESTIRRFATDFLDLLEILTGDPGATLGAVRKSAGEAATAGGDVKALLDQLGERDVRLFLEGDRLRVNAPRGALDDELKATISARRAEIMAHLALSGAPEERDANRIRRIPRKGRLPASSAQQRLWFLNQIDSGGPNYNIGGGLRFRGPLDIELLKQAIHTLNSRHESFRTRIVKHDGQPWVDILETSQTRVDVVDLSDRPVEKRDADSRRLGETLLSTPFDMTRGALARFLIIRLAEDDHIVVLAIHHVVSDGWSLAIACHEMCTLYDALATGRAAKLAPLPIDYVDYAAWEAEQLSAGHFDGHLAYWKRQLQGAPAALDLPSDRPRPPVPSHRGGRLRRYFDGNLIASLERYSREHNATLFMTLLAAWQVLMSRYSGQEDIVVGTPVANRDAPALEGVIGCLVNNIALRSQLGGNPAFAEFLTQVKQTTLSAFDHRALPFDKLVQGLNPERSASHAPIFQVLFALMSFPVQSLAPAGLSADFVDLDTGASRFDLTIEMGPVAAGKHAGQFGALYDFDSDLFDSSTIVRLHDHFANLLAAVATTPTCGINELPLMTAEEERQLLDESSAAALPHDRNRCIHHLLEATARSTPDAIAVTAGDAELSYNALDQRANRLAHLLRRRGVGPGALVAVCLDRTIDVPIALAAVLKAGAAYVPLDPAHPEERLHYVLGDAEASCLVTMSSFVPIFDGVGTPILLLDQESEMLAEESEAPPDVAVRPEDLAYVIYTSGSTGRPKGVEVEHRNVVSFLEAMRREPGLTATDTLLAVTTLSFDIAGLEIWLPLSVGAHVVIASRADVLDGARLRSLVELHAVTVLQATPASWRLLLEAGWTCAGGLKALCGGEAMPRDLAAALVDRTSELWNMYGPTETTIWSTVERVLDASAPITIGRAIANTKVFVLDGSGGLAPIGVVGELCIGGEGVARGYRKRPDLTSEKFVPITLPNGAIERVYRTGDMARFRADGRLELLGRRDHQVKVRGYRVELGEIESILATVAGVRTCVVVARELSPGDERLVGYIATTQGASFDAETARAVLRRKLPEYMVPNLFVVVAALPMTPNNKIDRKALPAPPTPERRSINPEAALMTAPQRRIADLWRAVLQTERIRLHDNFFDLGGHSLLLVKLHAELKREFATDFPLVELFQRTTVASQADRLSSISPSSDALARARTRAERRLHVT